MTAERNAHVHFTAAPVPDMDPRGEREAGDTTAKGGRQSQVEGRTGRARRGEVRL